MKRKRNTNAPSTPSLEVSGFRSPSDFKLEDEGPLSFNGTNVGVDLSSGSFNAADITVLAAVERYCYQSRTQPHSVCVQALLRLQNQHITNGKHMCDPSCLLTTYSTCLSLRSSTALLSDRHSSHLDFPSLLSVSFSYLTFHLYLFYSTTARSRPTHPVPFPFDSHSRLSSSYTFSYLFYFPFIFCSLDPLQCPEC